LLYGAVVKNHREKLLCGSANRKLKFHKIKFNPGQIAAWYACIIRNHFYDKMSRHAENKRNQSDALK